MVYISFHKSDTKFSSTYFLTLTKKNGRQSQIVFQGGRTNYVTVPIPYFFRAPV